MKDDTYLMGNCGVLWVFKLRPWGEMELEKVEVCEEICNTRTEDIISEDLQVQESKGTFSLFGTRGGR